jgi:hypothetical protein
MEITSRNGLLYAKGVRSGVEIAVVERDMNPDDEYGPRFGTVAGFTFRSQDIPAELPQGAVAEDDPVLLAWLAAKRQVQDQWLAVALPVIRELCGDDGQPWAYSETAMCACGCSTGFTAGRRLTVQGHVVDIILSKADGTENI